MKGVVCTTSIRKSAVSENEVTRTSDAGRFWKSVAPQHTQLALEPSGIGSASCSVSQKWQTARCGPPFGFGHVRMESLLLNSVGYDYLLATTLCVNSPNPSIPHSTKSPACRYRGGVIPIATPPGVPVEITSPGSSVMKRLM